MRDEPAETSQISRSGAVSRQTGLSLTRAKLVQLRFLLRFQSRAYEPIGDAKFTRQMLGPFRESSPARSGPGQVP